MDKNGCGREEKDWKQREMMEGRGDVSIKFFQLSKKSKKFNKLPQSRVIYTKTNLDIFRQRRKLKLYIETLRLFLILKQHSYSSPTDRDVTEPAKIRIHSDLDLYFKSVGLGFVTQSQLV